MDPHSYNLLVSYYNDGNGYYHYDPLMDQDGTLYSVTFVRTVDSTGINFPNITYSSTTGSSPVDPTFLNNEFNSLQKKPLNGNECQSIGWSYLGHMSTNSDTINAAISTASLSGFSFSSIFYTNGYFVYGSADVKQFYDVG